MRSRGTPDAGSILHFNRKARTSSPCTASPHGAVEVDVHVSYPKALRALLMPPMVVMNVFAQLHVCCVLSGIILYKQHLVLF